MASSRETGDAELVALVDTVTGTQERRIRGDNVSAYRARVQRDTG